MHSLRKVGDQAIGGLTDGVTYYVVNSTANTFQLAATSGGSAIALDPTDPVTHSALTGTSHIGTEGVDLTSPGSGEQQLIHRYHVRIQRHTATRRRWRRARACRRAIRRRHRHIGGQRLRAAASCR